MARVNDQQYAEKWAQRTSAASQAYVDGVRRVATAPGAQAAAAKQLYASRVQESTDKWARKVGAVSLADWQNMAATKGATNLSTGVNAARPKMQAAAQRLLQTVDSVSAQVRSMPKSTLEQRIARSAAMQRGMASAYSK